MQGYLTWQNPVALQLLWLAPLLAALVWLAASWRQATLREFLGARYVAAEWRWHRRRRLFKGVLSVVVFCLLVIAAARPRVGTEMQKVQRRGADVVLVMDTSDSMLAQDVRPSRLEAAKEAALALVGRLQGDRVGVVVFAASSYIYSPLTIDSDATSMFISSITRGSAPAVGTSLGDALTGALRLLQKAEHKHKAIVLFTDGEDHFGFKPEAVKTARDQGVRVHVVGLGSTEGEPIPIPDSESEGQGSQSPADMLDSLFGVSTDKGVKSKFKRDRNGEVVLTRLNEKLLTEIARIGGGVFIKSSPSGVNIDRIYQAIANMESGVVGTYQFTQHAERFQWPLGLAVLLLLLDALISESPRRKEAKRGAS